MPMPNAARAKDVQMCTLRCASAHAEVTGGMLNLGVGRLSRESPLNLPGPPMDQDVPGNYWDLRR